MLWIFFFHGRWYKAFFKIKNERTQAFHEATDSLDKDFDLWKGKVNGLFDRKKSVLDNHPNALKAYERKIAEAKEKKEQYLVAIEQHEKQLNEEKERHYQSVQ